MNVKRSLLAAALVLGVSASVVGPNTASAASYGADWQVSITYQNVGTAPTAVEFTFYAEGSGTPIPFSAGNLAPGASTSLLAGSVAALGSNFKGSAVLSAEQPVIATMVQLAPGIANRPLSNGFTEGASRQLVATVLKGNSDYNTVFSVQNTEAGPVDLSVAFYAAGSTTAVATIPVEDLPANSSKYFDVAQLAQIPAGFTGSAVVTATLANSATAANVVVSANELQTNGNGGSSFEGTPDSSANVYMPSALCNYDGKFSTAYAVQAVNGDVNFRVRYKLNGGGEVIDPATGSYALASGSKRSMQGCAPTALPAGSIGSAIIEKVSGAGTLVAVGKVFGGNISSAFLGFGEGTGSNKVALPYVRWSPAATYNTGQRQQAYIAIQNIGTTTATNVRVQYIDRDGVVKGTHTIGSIAPGAKANSNAAQASGALDSCGRFGEYGDTGGCLGTQFGGGAYVLADGGAQLAVVVRIQTGNPTQAGEDYTGVNVPN